MVFSGRFYSRRDHFLDKYRFTGGQRLRWINFHGVLLRIIPHLDDALCLRRHEDSVGDGRMNVRRKIAGDAPGAFARGIMILAHGAGSLKIDHPLYPADKYLVHSFVESPDMMNIYNGNVTTNAEGRSVVEVPEYFEALNHDFRYQLTVIGTFAQAIIEQEIKDRCFAIRTDKPHVKVSWQVTGVRQAPWANAHRLEVEPDKPADEHGRYLAPELYGKPEAARLHRPNATQVTTNHRNKGVR